MEDKPAVRFSCSMRSVVLLGFFAGCVEFALYVDALHLLLSVNDKKPRG